MRETASNTAIQSSIVMINLRPPTFSDPHLPTAHTEPPPCSSSLSRASSLTLSLYPCNSLSRSPQRLMQSVTNPECFPPIQTQREQECCAERGGGGGWFGCVLDVPILAVPLGHIRDKHQISLTKAAAPRHRSWHG